jgi:hypothetical protein
MRQSPQILGRNQKPVQPTSVERTSEEARCEEDCLKRAVQNSALATISAHLRCPAKGAHSIFSAAQSASVVRSDFDSAFIRSTAY